MRCFRKPEVKTSSELPSGKTGTTVVKKRPPTVPPSKPKARVLVQMSPEALKLFAYRYYRIGLMETGTGFHGETFAKANARTLKALNSILNVRFLKAYADREGT